MVCPKCGSENCEMQFVSENALKVKKHGLLYWIFVGWWLQPLLWFFLTIPMIIITIFKPKKYKMKTKTKKMAVCNNCGKSWEMW